jgi:hypothetical protein
MEIAQLESFYGVPVVIQLRFPIAAIKLGAGDNGKVPYAAERDKSHWIPTPLMEGGSPSGTQLVAFAVLHPVEGSALLEMVWSSVPDAPAEGSGSLIGPVATLATLLDARDIVAVTRVVNVHEPSPLILSGR